MMAQSKTEQTMYERENGMMDAWQQFNASESGKCSMPVRVAFSQGPGHC